MCSHILVALLQNCGKRLILFQSLAQKSVVEAESVQSLIEVVLISDNDYDSKISENEIKRLKLRLDNLPGIQIDEEKLRKLLMGKELTIDGVFKLLKEMEALPEEDRIIMFS